MQIAVLALQGAFIEHEKMLERLGVSCIEIRQKRDLNFTYDGLIIPGGESTVQGKLMRELELFEPIKEQIENGLPVFGTCASCYSVIFQNIPTCPLLHASFVMCLITEIR